jgi:hypothetical protein
MWHDIEDVVVAASLKKFLQHIHLVLMFPVGRSRILASIANLIGERGRWPNSRSPNLFTRLIVFPLNDYTSEHSIANSLPDATQLAFF